MSANQTTCCPKCGGAGWYMYDHNHSKPCEACCAHDRGWWLLTKHHANAGMWCCKAGCGEVRAENPEALAHGR
jgi:hypothetical protein